jgi:PIN domain nuclease of toxin-antitoxin system
MRLLLDTHALLWWLDGDLHLSEAARAAIGEEGNPVYVSAASAWEIATKVRIGKLPGALEVAERLPAILAEQAFVTLAIGLEHARRAGLLPGELRPDADRTGTDRRPDLCEQRVTVRPFRRQTAVVAIARGEAAGSGLA